MSNDDEKRAHITEHLAELRARLIRSIIYLLIGAVAAWFCYDYLLDFLTRPMMGVLDLRHARFLLTSFPEPFMIQLQTCIVAGLVICLPGSHGGNMGVCLSGPDAERAKAAQVDHAAGRAAVLRGGSGLLFDTAESIPVVCHVCASKCRASDRPCNRACCSRSRCCSLSASSSSFRLFSCCSPKSV